METLTPKNNRIKEMFSSIAHRYDFLNFLLSMGLDRYWRRVAIDQLNIIPGEKYIDVAAGTGDMAIEIAKRGVINTEITAVDFSPNMIMFGKEKVKKLHLKNKVKFHLADGENLPFEDNSFYSAVCAFGIRNFSNPPEGLKEIRRVIKEKGLLLILEFSTPKSRIFKFFYYFYFKKMLPLIGGLVSGKTSAYRYLPDSVLNFYTQEEFKIIMQKAGLKKVNCFNLTFGIVTVYIGYK